jgi:hypothetical protein
MYIRQWEPCALGSTQPLKMSTRNSPGGEGGRCVELTTNHPSSAERQEIRGLNLPGPPRAPGGLLREYLYLYIRQCRKMYNIKVLDTCLWSMIMVYPHAQFHIPGSSSFLENRSNYSSRKFSQGCPVIILYELLLLRETAFGHLTFSIRMDRSAAVKNFTS